MPITIELKGEEDDGGHDFYPEDLEPEQLFMSTYSFIKLNDKWGVFLNDTWYWGTADFEEIPSEEYEAVSALYHQFGRAGLYRWVYGKRGHFPAFDDYTDMIKAVLGVENRRYDHNGHYLGSKEPEHNAAPASGE